MTERRVRKLCRLRSKIKGIRIISEIKGPLAPDENKIRDAIVKANDDRSGKPGREIRIIMIRPVTNPADWPRLTYESANVL